jgi:hypothetical protein
MKKYLLILSLLLIAGCSLKPPFIGGGTAVSAVKLVASSTDIIDSTLINTDKGQVVKYAYKTKTVVASRVIMVGPNAVNENLAERLPNADFFHSGSTIKAILYSADVQTNVNGTWYQVNHATATISDFQKGTAVSLIQKIKNFLVKEVLADSASYSASSGDGSVLIAGSTDTWANIVVAAAGTTIDGTSVRGEAALTNSGSKRHLWRGFVPINTSPIPDNATISAASLTFYVQGPPSIVDADSWAYETIYGPTSQASTSTLGTADYNKYGTTAWSTNYNLSGLNSSGTDTYTLNAAGIAAINKTGYTKFGIRDGHDSSGNSPGTNGGPNYAFYYTSSTGGSAPYVTVTYTVPGSAVSSPSQIIITE